MRSVECMPKMNDNGMYAQNEYGMYAQNEGWNEKRDGMECMPKIRHGEYGIYAQNDG